MLYYITAGDKAEEKPGLYLLNTETGVKTLIKEGDGVFKQVTFDEDGANLAFLYCAQKDSCYKAMSLWLSQQEHRQQKLRHVAIGLFRKDG